jgi:hypothetical protein
MVLCLALLRLQSFILMLVGTLLVILLLHLSLLTLLLSIRLGHLLGGWQQIR